jgi:hypothetical protein
MAASWQHQRKDVPFGPGALPPELQAHLHLQTRNHDTAPVLV